MDGVSSVSGVGLRQAQFSVQYQATVLAKEQQVIRDLGTAALKLIENAVASTPYVGQNVNLVA